MKIQKIRKKREIDAPFFCKLGKAFLENRKPTPEEWDSCDVKRPHRHCICLMDQPPGHTAPCAYCQQDADRHKARLQRIAVRNQLRSVAA